MKYDIRIATLLVDLLSNDKVQLSDVQKLIKPAKKGVDADFAINCFALRRFYQKDGNLIAQDINKLFTPAIIKENNFLASIENTGPYLNFKLNKAVLAKEIFSLINQDIDQFSRSSIPPNKESKRIVIEYPAPNTNKPLHLGHVRNMILGQTLGALNRKIGNEVFEVNLMNDRGIHIMKSIWAYLQFGEGKTPESENVKPDHFVGRYYVKFAQKEAELKQGLENKIDQLNAEKKKTPELKNTQLVKELSDEINKTAYGQMQQALVQMLIKWEQKDPEIRAIWKKMNKWAETGFQETFQMFGINQEKVYFESEIYDQGKEIVLKGLNEGIFEKLDDGAVVIRFQKKGFPKQKVLLRSDGTALYMTQDLYLAFQKMKDFQYDLSIYIVGNEQDMQLRTLFEILRKLGMKGKNVHYSYGMINLTTGKMKSREGTVVDADDIVENLRNLGLTEMKSRYEHISEQELRTRAKILAMAALRFFILKYEYRRDFLFNPKDSIAFEGETGPYILYAYARICSIFQKAIAAQKEVPFNPKNNQVQPDYFREEVDFSLITAPEEIVLVEKLYEYPDILMESAEQLKPHVLTRYLFELSQNFTNFYHSCHVLDQPDPILRMRMILIESVRKVLKDGLNTIYIDVLNEM